MPKFIPKPGQNYYGLIFDPHGHSVIEEFTFGRDFVPGSPVPPKFCAFKTKKEAQKMSEIIISLLTNQ